MSASKHFDRIAVAVTALMLVVTLLFLNGGALGIEAMAHTMGYEARLFDNTRVHAIDIVMDDWDDLIANAISEEYYAANVVIDGESYKNVGIRAKGNTSLSTVASLGSERYSFKIEFDHYDDTKSYHGLDKLSLNNLIQDSTMMKDYLTYTLMQAFGTFSGGDADGAVNTPIDAPVSGGTGEDRPMWYWIVADETYTDLYHQYFAEFLSSVDVQQIIDDAYNLIKSYVEQDPTAFYSYEEFETGVETLQEFCALCSESISQQLETGETTEDMGYADGSHLSLSDMGTMNNGQGGMGGDKPNRTAPTGEETTEEEAATASAQPGGMGEAPTGRPEDMELESLSDEETGEQQETEVPTGGAGGGFAQSRPTGGRQMPGGSFDGSAVASTGIEIGWIWIAASSAILLLGLAVAFKFRRYKQPVFPCNSYKSCDNIQQKEG